MKSHSFALTSLSLSTLLAFALGCNEGPVTDTPAVHDDHGDHGHADGEHEHPTEGPHHGALVELGAEEFHAEVVHDDKAGVLTVYLLDAAAKEPAKSESAEVMINVKHDGKPAQFTLAAKTDGAEGGFTEYSLASKELLDALHEGSSAKLSLTINGKPYSGTVPHEDHAAHDHAH